MENSPKLMKRNTHLSFSAKHRLSDSPKTPIRNKKLAPNDGFETPPPISKLNNINCFGEESPSQDYDYSSIPMSQDIITHYRDVTWKWNDEIDNQQQQVVNPKSKKADIPAIVQKIQKSRKTIEGKHNKIDKTKGFYKLQELLLAEGGNLKKLLNKNDKINSDNRCGDKIEKLQSNFKENTNTTYDKSKEFVKQIELKSNNKKINNLLPQKSNKNNWNNFHENCVIDITEENINENDIIDLLDDSDSDNLLVQLTQEIENNIDNTKSTSDSDGSLHVNVGKKKSNLNNIKKTSHFDNDSIDELLLTLPIDENIIKNTSFSRHNSMPPQISNSINNNATNTLLRHSSANCIRIEKNKSSPKSVNLNTNGKLSPFSDGSLDSLYATASDIPLNKKCTKAEVEMKRQEAKLRRLQSQKRRELTQKSQFTKK